MLALRGSDGFSRDPWRVAGVWSRSSRARSCCKNRYLVTLTFAPLERNRGSRPQTHKNSMVFDSLLLRQDRCLSSSHLSCLNSRHLSCLNRRHLSCLNRRHHSSRPAAGSRPVFCSGKLWLAQCVRCVAGSTRRGLTRGEESEEGGDSVQMREGLAEDPLLFPMFLGGLKIDRKMVPKK